MGTRYLQLTFEGKAALWVWTLNLGNLVAPGSVKIEMDCWTPSWCPQKIRELVGVRKHSRRLEFAKQNNREEGSPQQLHPLHRSLEGVSKNLWLNACLHMPEGVKGHQKAGKTMPEAHTGWEEFVILPARGEKTSHVLRYQGEFSEEPPLSSDVTEYRLLWTHSTKLQSKSGKDQTHSK